MLLLAIVVWFVLTIPVGIFVGRRIAGRRSADRIAHESGVAPGHQAAANRLDKSA